MPLPESHLHSYLQESYVNAVVSEAGYGCAPQHKDYGIDVTISEMQEVPQKNGHNTIEPSGHEFKAQLKSTIVFEKKDGCVLYDLSADAYNKIARYNRNGRMVLILMCLPRGGDTIKRFEFDEAGLTLRHCCYWHIIGTQETSNKESVRIKIDRRNVFNAESVRHLMNLVANDRWLNHASDPE